MSLILECVNQLLFGIDGSDPQGLWGFYKGLRPTLVAVPPFVALQQTSVDLSKNLLLAHGYTPSPPVPSPFVYGAHSPVLCVRYVIYTHNA